MVRRRRKQEEELEEADYQARAGRRSAGTKITGCESREEVQKSEAARAAKENRPAPGAISADVARATAASAPSTGLTPKNESSISPSKDMRGRDPKRPDVTPPTAAARGSVATRLGGYREADGRAKEDGRGDRSCGMK